MAFFATAERVRALRKAGYRVIENWRVKKKKRKALCQTGNENLPPRSFLRFRIIPRQNAAMRDLLYENAHMPISVSLGDTLDHQPTHICDPNTQELIRRFMEELEQRGTCVPW